MKGKIIWNGQGLTAYRKRGSSVLQSVVRNPASSGFVGSDCINEERTKVGREQLAPVVNKSGKTLRFALIAKDADRLRAKLDSGELLKILTSYPLTAMSVLGMQDTIEYQPGCIEAEIDDRADEFDGAFEVVQSGDSVRVNGLEVVEDYIERIYLERVWRLYD